MKKRYFWVWIGLVLQSFSAWGLDEILNIYTWAGYLPDSVIREFEAETGIRVNHSTYANNEILYAKLKANSDVGYDIIIPSSYFVSRMISQDLLQKIDHTQLPNLREINPVFLKKSHDPENDYSVPYLWNVTGIVVNSQFHDIKKIKSWNDLWRPEYRDQLLVFDDTREVFSIALLALGYSINDTNPTHIQQAFSKLKLLMNNIKLFNLDAQRSIYLDEDITIGMGWNGDIYLASLENPHLHFIFPKEGGIISLDSMAIPKKAKHVAAAHRFIDFILRPSIATKITLETGFSTPNLGALNLLPETVQQNKILYPEKAVLEQCQVLDNVGDAVRTYEKYFELLKLEE
jgi:spermidine/putrescine transport system substrate-binding protein